MHDETLTIKKSYADPLHFKYVDFDDTEKVLNRINETFDVNNFEFVALRLFSNKRNVVDVLLFDDDNLSSCNLFCIFTFQSNNK
mgnify:CR=1 FL=1